MKTAQTLESWTARCGLIHLIQRMSWSWWKMNSGSSGSLRKTSSIRRRKILSRMIRSLKTSESWWTNHLRHRSCAMTIRIRGQSHGAMSQSCCRRRACRRHRGHDRDSRCCPGAWVDGAPMADHAAVLYRVEGLWVDTSVDISGGACMAARDTFPEESSRSCRGGCSFRDHMS